LKQRIPYYFAIPVAAIALFAVNMKWSHALTRALYIIVGLLVIWSLVLAAYHSGVEWAWWAGPSECGASGGSGEATTSADNLLSQLSFSKPPSCDEAAGRFLGLSFAGWNVVVSTVIASLAFRVAVLARK
jgi:disulfide bond formation protein DsbB